jgi:hypothetical protein
MTWLMLWNINICVTTKNVGRMEQKKNNGPQNTREKT